VAATLVILLTKISLFQVAIVTQTINAVMLPLVFYFLLKLTNDPRLMGEYVNNRFQRVFATGATIVILAASFLTVILAVWG